MTFLTAFSRRLDEAPDAQQLYASIVDAFSHVTRSSSTELWTVNAGRGEYRRQAWVGSDCNSLPAALRESPAMSQTLFSSADILGRDEAQRRCPPEAASTLDEILGACHSNVIVPLRSKGHLVGFCTMRMSDCGDLHKAAVARPLLLIVQMSAGALQHRLSKNADRCSRTLLRRTDRLRSLEIIAGGFAHEIRNPLTSIKTFVQLAPERREDVRFIHEFSRLAVQDIHRIERLLEEIIDYTRCIVPSPTEEDVNELVSSCVSFIAIKASSRSIRVRTVLAEGLPLLSLDRQQIKQALINLLLNALQAAQDHGKEIAVRTFLGQRPGGGSGVCIEIRDDGRGIPAEHIEHIFDPFFTTEHSNGAGDIRGLGLTIAHQIVREHQGDLTVESREGAGSTFCLFIPIDAPPLQRGHTGAT
ncbi:MAG TPA: ATP-binding protein [Nitrospiraceae bacterium]|nr:ATP-binding protein [Nitrospiraceae bacterium]